MTDSERVLGRLEEFKEWSKLEYDRLHLRMNTLERNLESLQRVRWMVTGGAVVVSAVTTFLLSQLIK